MLAAEAARQRTMNLLENAIAARCGQSTTDGFKEFAADLKKKIGDRR